MFITIESFLSSCSLSSFPVINDHEIETSEKISMIKKEVEVGDRVVLVADGVEYKDHYIALLKDEEMILIAIRPKRNEQNYIPVRYESIDKLEKPSNDDLGMSITFALIIFYLLI